ncbi:NADH dehydrogenase [ubiquinone] 1 alpha subcomplex assembly factor [Lachnellula occidentalis]|uniref:NADH dehydrogenase [ubiquinone] 1 alpha subcomplex assembly factor n=1 Tax=Lachnellula occidentalis TaxID=215460 RepID=A0A8H8RGV3_9HELO|nr:NADH dehydrogenase [ubiquinone] 1 alpha subcomplex assembly factor [Lachnellula occidentalis]
MQIQPTIRTCQSLATRSRCIARISSPKPKHLTPTPRRFSTSPISPRASPKPRTHDRGPASTEDTQTDFSSLDVLGNTPTPSTSIDACAWDGFHLNSGVKVVGGKGVLLVNGEAFGWCPWEAEGGVAGGRGWLMGRRSLRWGMRLGGFWGWCGLSLVCLALLAMIYVVENLLILGLGKDMRPISPKTRQYIQSLGIRVDIQDTRNAAAQFNLLATERGVGSVAAALIPMGFREGVGVE